MRLSKWAVVRRATTIIVGVVLSLNVTMAPAAAQDGVIAEREPATAMAAWMREFSRLAGAIPEDSSAASWRRDLGLLRAFAAADDAAARPERDWVGLARDTGLLLGYQLVTTGIIMLLPEDVSRWSDKSADDLASRWVENVQDPTIDDDAWWINYIMHPYFGAVYYIRARERGFGEFPSFLYSAFASTMYEFGVEAFFEKPSIQDLIVTPVAGALIGAFVFEPIRRRILSKPDLEWYDHVGLVLTDPLGALNYVVERMFGIKSTIRVMAPTPGVRNAHRPDGGRDRAVGLQLSVPWN